MSKQGQKETAQPETQPAYRVAAVFPLDVTESAQAREDDHLRSNLKRRAEAVRSWCDRVIAETNTTKPLDDLSLDLSGIAYPIAELLQFAGAVDRLRLTRLGPGEVITIERTPPPQAASDPRGGARKRARR